MGGEVKATTRAVEGQTYEGVYRLDERGEGSLDRDVVAQVVEDRGHLNVTDVRSVPSDLVAVEATVVEATEAGNLFGAWINDGRGNWLRLEGWTHTGNLSGPISYLDPFLFEFEEAMQAGATWLEMQRREARSAIGDAAGEAVEQTTRGAVGAAAEGARRAVEGALEPVLGENAAGRVSGLALWGLLALAAWWIYRTKVAG